MGCILGAPKDAESRENSKIDHQQHEDEMMDRNQIKLLLLGAGESGKSTLFKQMKALYGQPWTQAELASMAPLVCENVMSNLFTLVGQAKTLNVTFEKPEIIKKITTDYSESTTITSSVAELLRQAWNDAGVKALWENRAKTQVLECLGYYMKEENLSRIQQPKYVPTTEDALLARIRTTGIMEEVYVIDGLKFRVFDVGGQRNERKKWIHCFEDVTAVIFVVAVSEYDQVLFEDLEVPRMQEALQLFETTINSKWFKKTSSILFFNKIDLFKEKLRSIPIKIPGVRFDDFKGPACVPGEPSSVIGTPEYEACLEAGQQYFSKMFLAKVPNKPVYVHFTCAMDKQMTNKVFHAVKDIILRSNLEAGGFTEGMN